MASSIVGAVSIELGQVVFVFEMAQGNSPMNGVAIYREHYAIELEERSARGNR